MKCPFCGSLETKVSDSRMTKEGESIRRRRECESCHRRFTTYERVEESLPLIIKKDKRREAYDRNKVLAGLRRACEKRPISAETIQALVDRLEITLQERGEKEVHSSVVGEQLLHALLELDAVAYVRFASVYREFQDIGQFMAELNELLQARRDPSPASAETQPVMQDDGP